MARRKKKFPIIERMSVETAGAEGKTIGHYDGKVVMVNGLVPGDVADIQVTKKRRNYLEGKAIKIHDFSERRAEPFCTHFGLCGGCKWQNMAYDSQLYFKEKQVKDQLLRIGHLEVEQWHEIMPAPKTKNYRNKLEFTFSNRKWLTIEEIKEDKVIDRNGLGFHIPGAFDKVVDLEECHLQADPSDRIRSFVRKYAADHHFSFFDLRQQNGFLRNLIVRTTAYGECMVIISFFHEDYEKRSQILNALKTEFPEITALMFVINEKKNDSLYDQKIINHSGNDFIIEKLGDQKFKIGPKSFFQTNSQQALTLYQKALSLAQLKSTDIVYDIYSGTGTISCFLAPRVKQVIGVEQIEEAVDAAKENARVNNIENASFYCGDARLVLNNRFFKENGNPDVILVDPPRAGLHPTVVEEILVAKPNRFVYISCNPATQARDLALMKEDYKVTDVCPVDMFPQTHHVENIAVLIRKKIKADSV